MTGMDEATATKNGLARAKAGAIRELIAEKLVAMVASVSILLLLLIFLFLAKDGLPLFKDEPLGQFLSGSKWYPISSPPVFGILPLIAGTLAVTIGAALISIPLGIGTAVYIAEIAGPKSKDILKSLVELIAGVPSVALGFIGITILSTWVKNLFDLPTGLTALTGSIALAFMAVPTIATITEDAIYSVPREYAQASLAMGATRWQTMWKVTLPAASSGILAASLLGVGRVVGETMVVMMVCGNAAVIPHSILVPVRTMTATIAAEMGETVRGGSHYQALFAIGLVLFAISFTINLLSELVVRRKKRGAGK